MNEHGNAGAEWAGGAGHPGEQLDEYESQAEPLSWEDFEARLHDIQFEISKYADMGDVQTGVKSAHVEYVEKEPSAELQRFGKLMLLAPKAREEGLKILKLVNDRSQQSLGEWQDEAAKLELQKSRRLVCAYNQMLGAMVADNEAGIPRRKLEAWLAQASNGDQEWAAAIVAGVATERAAEKLLAGMPEVDGVLHGDLDQDLMGQDLVFDPTPAGFSSLDVKSRSHRGVMPLEPHSVSGRLTLYIDPAHMDRNGYAVQDHYTRGYRAVLRRGLIEGRGLEPEAA